MPLIMTNYIITSNIIKKLDLNYEVDIRKKLDNGKYLFKSDKIFLYSNFLEIIDAYHSNYSITNKILDENIWGNILSNSTEYIRKNHYNKENILFLLSIMITRNIRLKTKYYFDFYQDKYKWNSDILMRDHDYYYASLNSNYDLTKPLINNFTKAFNYDFNDSDFIKNLINDNLYFPLGDRLFFASTNEFKKIISKKSSHKTLYKKFYYTNEKKNLTNKEFLNSPHYNKTSYNDLLESIFIDSYNDALEILQKIY